MPMNTALCHGTNMLPFSGTPYHPAGSVLESSAAPPPSEKIVAKFAPSASERTNMNNSSRNSPQATPVAIESCSLGSKLLGDVVVASSITFTVSPFLTIVDKAIVQRAAGTHTATRSCLETSKIILRDPASYVKSPAFLLMWGVYAATYTTANCLKTITEHKDSPQNETMRVMTESVPPDEKRSKSSMGVFLGTSIINSAGSLVKERAYAAMFGSSQVAQKRVPAISYALWCSRDFLVVGSSFILPDRVCPTIEDQTGLSHTDALKVAQVFCPVVTQFVAGPLQLLGLDFYNRPLAGLSYRHAALDRASFLWQGAPSVIGARVARIIPGYCVGGVGNTFLRDKYRQGLVQWEERRLSDLGEEMSLKKGPGLLLR